MNCKLWCHDRKRVSENRNDIRLSAPTTTSSISELRETTIFFISLIGTIKFSPQDDHYKVWSKLSRCFVNNFLSKESDKVARNQRYAFTADHWSRFFKKVGLVDNRSASKDFNNAAWCPDRTKDRAPHRFAHFSRNRGRTADRKKLSFDSKQHCNVQTTNFAVGPEQPLYVFFATSVTTLSNAKPVKKRSETPIMNKKWNGEPFSRCWAIAD